MSDITKCTGDGCANKEQCYRYTAKMGEYQSMFVNPPVKDSEMCPYYWPNEEKK